MMPDKTLNMVVLCTNSEGATHFHSCLVTASQHQIDNGSHHDMAKYSAQTNGYKGPMIAFDATDLAAGQLEALASFIEPSKRDSYDRAAAIAAREVHCREGEVEIDPRPDTSRGDDTDGAYVAAWVWVEWDFIKEHMPTQKDIDEVEARA